MAKRVVVTTKVVRLVESNEWMVKAYDQDGVRFVDADYYTDDKADAEGTAKVMLVSYQRVTTHRVAKR